VQQGQARPGLNDQEWSQFPAFCAQADSLRGTVDFELKRLVDFELNFLVDCD
jgi:hypothetical protein